MMNHQCGRLAILPFGIALGVVSGLGSLVLAWLALKYQMGAPMVHQMASLYKSYAPTMEGALWGGLWGFVHGFVVGVLIALIYNLCLKCCCFKTKKL